MTKKPKHESGRAKSIAQDIATHEMLEYFLTSLGISKEQAEKTLHAIHRMLIDENKTREWLRLSGGGPWKECYNRLKAEHLCAHGKKGKI